MSDKNFKAIRKQIRNVVKEFLPDVLSTEYTASIHKRLSEELTQRMDVIANGARETLKNIDERQKDFQNYVVKEISKHSALPTLNVQDTPEVKTE